MVLCETPPREPVIQPTATTVKARIALALERQDGLCFLSGEPLSPGNVVGILNDGTDSIEVENVRWVTRDVGRMVDTMGVSSALDLMETILRHSRPELFCDDSRDMF
jgi:hypothetical protein